MKKEEIKAQILKLRNEAVKGFDFVKDDFLYLESGYLALMDEKKKRTLKARHKSHVAQKIIFAKVRRITKEILKTYFANPSLADIEVRGDAQLSAILQNELNTLSRARLNLYSRIHESIIAMLVYGTSIAKVYWADNEVKVVPKRLSEVLIDPHAKNHFDAKYYVDRFYMTIADIKRNFAKELKDEKIDLDTISGENTSKSPSGDQSSDLGEYRRIAVQEIYRKIGDDWFISTCINDRFLRLDLPLHDGCPFFFAVAYPQFCRIEERGAVRSYGASYIEPMIDLQRQFIAVRNQQMDAVYLQLNPRYFADRSSGLRDDDLASLSPKVVVSNLAAIKEIPAPNINGSVFDTQSLDAEIQEVGGMPKMVQGISASSDPRNATGMSLLAQSGNATIDDIVTSYNESFFEPFISRIVSLIYRHKITEALSGYDRDKKIELRVSINAGVGVMSRDTKINNIGAAKQSLLTMIKMLSEMGAKEKVREYVRVLEGLVRDELREMGQKNVDELFPGEIDFAETQSA